MRWQLQHRASMSPRQLVLSLSVLLLVSGLVAAFFWVQGVRFVTYFAGLELTAVMAAFAWHAVHAADGETLTLHDGQLLLERRHGLRCTGAVMPVERLRASWSERGLIELRAGAQTHVVGRHADGAGRIRVFTELRQALGHSGVARCTPE